MYFNGIGVEKDLKTAFSYFKIAADKSNPEAQFAVGTMYYCKHSDFFILMFFHVLNFYLVGQGTEKSLSTAFHYFSLASDQGHLQATYNLGQFYEYGIGTVPSCLNAVKMKKLVAERGPWMQDLKTAHRSFLHGHYERSTLLYARLGIEGVQLAQKNAAYLLDEGYGYFESETHNLAFKLWKSSSRQGDSDAHRIVGDYYYYGVNGSPPDYGKAVEQYRLAGDLRNARALFDLGFMYHSGLGIGRDLHLAKRYYDLAMEVDVQAYAPCTVAVSILQIELFFRGLFSPFSGSKIDVDKSGSQSAPLNDQDETSIWGDLKEQFNLFWKDIFDAAGIDQEDFLLEDFILLGAIAGLIAIVMARHHQVRLEAQFPNLPENRRGQPRAPPVGPGLNNQLPPQDVDNEEKEDVVEPENEDR